LACRIDAAGASVSSERNKTELVFLPNLHELAVSALAEVFAQACQFHRARNFVLAEQLFRQVIESDPSHTDGWLYLGAVCQAQGKCADAEASFRRVIQSAPHHAKAQNCLAAVLVAQGKLDQAVVSLQHALRWLPDDAELHNNLGAVFVLMDRNDAAAGSFQEALRCNPDLADVHRNLGTVLKQQGQLAAAIEQFREALRCQPENLQAVEALGQALAERRDLTEAEACFRQIVRLRPQYADGHNNLGNTLAGQGKLGDAAACYRGALALNPSFADAHYNLGNTLKKQGKLEEAAASYREALQFKPNYPAAYLNLGNILLDQNQLEKAVLHYEQALVFNPRDAHTLNNLGLAKAKLGQLEQAIAYHKQALALSPQLAEIHINLGSVLKKQGQIMEAIQSFRQALQLQVDCPAVAAVLVHQLQQVCLWQDLQVLSQGVTEAVEHGQMSGIANAVPPLAFLSLPVPTTPQQHLHCASQWVQGLVEHSIPRDPFLPLRQPRSSQTRITVGYLSADFRAHPVANMIGELIEKHDRERFAIFGYSYGPDDGSSMRRRLVRAFDQFVDAKDASLLETAHRIHSDEVDILVDLQGYTELARTEIMALRPAPIQVNFLGYPGTMAAPFMDYILVDDFVVPPPQQQYYTEKLVQLPGCFLVNDSKREVSPRIPSRAECGLPELGFVFCCFNSTYKITAEVFRVWMRLLGAIPGSVLWLLESNRWAPTNLRREAQAQGVSPDRLVFAPPVAIGAHLARHRLADLFLDTVPYNAHTTASDALWVGCLVLTIAGVTFPSRVAGSLLRTLGLPELITISLEDYYEMALRLAQDGKFLAELRARLAANRLTSRLFDGGHFARNLEKAYATMWELYTSGQKPQPFAVTLNDTTK
jgi:protein O-GlcNAc transferase